ncbi:enoyl-CoA hydratase/isomerase family protein [Anaeromyxobacter sp. Fw109-5]|uniref:enoyl-CoA hydratase/isomerase family protein n=1 Tax=Anaeromyxobacter sp. (strain Fw109-5) TaxID=404589 RepID=UPI0000ED8B98|nr:enoyl-CoA hydratase-related protein [Anaeromyxobacter sp. Fw109-5]ABS26338.1 Enoyl-CoA hydratase/isomerase [Anaeromyxobacter sp. Fw109-5]
MTYENILWDVQDGIGTLTFNRPKVLNAMNARTFEELADLVRAVEADPALRAIVVTGAGEKAFVAGADIAAMSAMNPVDARRFAEAAHDVLERLERLPIPTIAAVNGYALGGGCEVTLACDLVYASDRARFGQPEVNLGLIPGFGGTQRLARRVGVMRALEIVLTAEPIDAAQAKAIGLVLDVLPAADLLAHAREKARKIASKGPVAVAQAKRVLRRGAEPDLATANELERQAFAALFGSADAKEGMRAFLEKRPAKWTGA